jgi:hypothetical protein
MPGTSLAAEQRVLNITSSSSSPADDEDDEFDDLFCKSFQSI